MSSKEKRMCEEWSERSKRLERIISKLLHHKSSELDNDIQILPSPPPKPPPPIFEISDDEDGDIPEIVPCSSDTNHPLVPPILPFGIVNETTIPPPKLTIKSGKGKSGNKAVILRMESQISKVPNLQYRVFFYFENSSEPENDRRWKQLTCIKLQSGRVCECTLIKLIEQVRYHFVVCLIQDNNRSRFSNCAPHVF